MIWRSLKPSKGKHVRSPLTLSPLYVLTRNSVTISFTNSSPPVISITVCPEMPVSVFTKTNKERNTCRDELPIIGHDPLFVI